MKPNLDTNIAMLVLSLTFKKRLLPLCQNYFTLKIKSLNYYLKLEQGWNAA